jgi:hypothetical protein
MFLNLLEKVNYEYGKYVSYLHLISRADFMSRAYEIAVKQAIYERLIKEISKDGIGAEKEKKMMQMGNVVDEIYLKGNTKNIITLKHGEITDSSWSQLLVGIDF